MKVIIFDSQQTLLNLQHPNQEFINTSKSIYEALASEISTLSNADELLGPVLNEVIKEDWENQFATHLEKTLKEYYQQLLSDPMKVKSMKELVVQVSREISHQDSPAQLYFMKDQFLDLCEIVLENQNAYSDSSSLFQSEAQILQQLHEEGYKLCILSNDVFKKKLIFQLKQFDILNLFEEVLFAEDVHVAKPSPAGIEFIKNKFGVKDYEVCFVGDMLDEDILCGNNARVRTLWFTQNPAQPQRNVDAIKKTKPHITFSQFLQIPNLLRILSEDAEMISSNNLEDSYLDQVNYSKLPISQKIHCGYYFYDTKDLQAATNGLSISDKRILFEHLQFQCGLEHFHYDMIFHKATDLLVASDENSLFGNLFKYCSERKNSMLVIDPLESLNVLALRAQTNTEIEKVIASAEAKSISEKYGITLSAVFSFEIENLNSMQTFEAIMQQINSNHKMLPFFIKSGSACQTDASHQMGVVQNEIGLKEALDMDIYKNCIIIMQDFIKHSQTIYKVYTIGDNVSYFAKVSIPSQIPQDKHYQHFNSQKPFPDDWYNGNKTFKDEINMQFVKEICNLMNTHFNVTLMGYDFIIDENTGEYFIIDLNYFPSYRHLGKFGNLMRDFLVNEYIKFKQLIQS